ncbi:MAG: hypothetical protein Q7S82_00150 [bacterium]|nr:hypothetical protein [bacterium]
MIIIKQRLNKARGCLFYMPYRKTFFEKNQPAHIISRALIDVFRDKEECYRFVFQFYAANLGKRGSNVRIRDAIKAGQALLQGENIPSSFVAKEHPPLVDLLDFSLVINHYHFYLVPNIENAIPILTQKLNTGFAKSFNLTHNRKDAVFGSRYKGVVVKTDFQSDAVSRYVSIINPLDVFQPGWREDGLRDIEKALDFLKDYEFSSFPDKAGERNAKILAPDEILKRYSLIDSPDNKKKFQEFAKEFLKERKSYPSYFLE